MRYFSETVPTYDVAYFKIGSTDSLCDELDPLDDTIKLGRIPEGFVSETVTITKIYFLIEEDVKRKIFKTRIESYLLKKTKDHFTNPGADIGLKLKKFRSIDYVTEYMELAHSVVYQHGLSAVF